MSGAMKGVLGGFVCVAAWCGCGGGLLFVFEVPFFLAFGWIPYLATVLPRVRPNPAGIAFLALTLPLAAWLAHGLCRWLYDGAGRRWRWKWTALGFAAVMLMFVAGIAATGVVHQAGWLIGSREPLTISSWRARVDKEISHCEANLRQISQAIAAYSAANAGYVPKDRADLVRSVASEGGLPDWFFCGDTRYGPKPATRSAGWVSRVSQGDEHFTYHYFSSPIIGPDGKRRVRMCDREIHHMGGFMGLVVLYEDGQVEVLDEDAARAWLKDRFALEPAF